MRQTPPVALHVLARSVECVRARRELSSCASDAVRDDKLVDALFLRELRIVGGRSAVRDVTSEVAPLASRAQPRSVHVSWRSQPSGHEPTTSVGELNSIGEPKNPSVVHPPHSTVLRREERKGKPYTADRQNNNRFIFVFSLFFFLFQSFVLVFSMLSWLLVFFLK